MHELITIIIWLFILIRFHVKEEKEVPMFVFFCAVMVIVIMSLQNIYR